MAEVAAGQPAVPADVVAAAAARERRFASTDGVTLCAFRLEAKQEPPVAVAVLVHGLFRSAMELEPVAAMLHEQGCECWLLDLRNHGGSSRAPFTGGLRELADLGVLWEAATGGPLPLGVIAARRDLDDATLRAIRQVLRASVELARRAPNRPRPFVRAHAQELGDDVCDRHIALYVNHFTEDLGDAGRAAIEALLARGRAAGLLVPGPSVFREDT